MYLLNVLTEECKAIKHSVGIYIMLAHHVWHVGDCQAGLEGGNNKSASSREGTE